MSPPIFFSASKPQRLQRTRVTSLDDGRSEANLTAYLLRIQRAMQHRCDARGTHARVTFVGDIGMRLTECTTVGHELRAKSIQAHTPTIAADMAYNLAVGWP